VLRTSWAGRSAKVAKLGARVGGNYASTAARKVFASTERRIELDERRELKTASAVAEQLGQMKGALMKLGQMASYLDEGLPEPMRMALAQLRSGAPPMSAQLAAGVVEAELGSPPDELFVEWDPAPIAAASIGQVHRAIARHPDTGEETPVAVKVQYPGVDEAITADLKNAGMLGTILKQGFGGLDPDDMVAEIKERLAEELDYRLEARNQAEFADYYRGHPYIHVPDVVPAYSSGRVLTSQLVNGATWDELLTWSRTERDLARFLDSGRGIQPDNPDVAALVQEQRRYPVVQCVHCGSFHTPNPPAIVSSSTGDGNGLAEVLPGPRVQDYDVRGRAPRILHGPDEAGR